jgi:hypothetical protein
VYQGARLVLGQRDFSSPVTALIWQSRRLRSGSAGICSARRRRRVSGWPAIRPGCSGRKKWKISRERGAGSALSVKRMIWPVASNRKGSGVLSAPFEVGGMA